MMDKEIKIRCDMCKDSYLEILRQDDGDIILSITSKGISDTLRTSSIELCMPMSGGGKHPELFNLLVGYYNEYRETEK